MTHSPDKVAPMATNPTTDRITEVNPSLSTIVSERIRMKDELEQLTERLKSLDSIIIAEFQSAGLTKVETEIGKLNLVQSNTVAWNEEVLKGLLKPAQWKRIVVEKVDKIRLEAELLVGRISEDEVDVAKSIKQSKPFLR